MEIHGKIQWGKFNALESFGALEWLANFDVLCPPFSIFRFPPSSQHFSAWHSKIFLFGNLATENQQVKMQM